MTYIVSSWALNSSPTPADVIFYSYNTRYSISAAGGAYSAPPDLSAAFKGPTSKGKERGMRRGPT